MSIAAECTTCGKKYQAPDNMAGKRVRCKQCGNIFTLAGGDKNASTEADALAELERSFHSLDSTGTGMPSGEGGDEDAEGGESGAYRTARANVRFDFPLSKDIDHWLPRVLSMGGIALLALVCYKLNETGVAWMPALWFVVALLAYVMLVGPLTHAMIRRAGQYIGYQMPSADRRRAFGSILAGYVLTYLLWGVGGGQIVALVLGCIAGLAVATACIWLLFRLLPKEVAPTAGYVGLGYVLGVAIAGGAMFGLNILLMQVIIQTKQPDLLPSSPFGNGFTWISADKLDDMRRAIAKAHPTTPTGASAAVSHAPVLPVANSPLVRKADLAGIDGPFDDVIPPLVDAHFTATVRKADDNYNVTIWDTDTWKQTGSTLFKSAPDASGNRFILSPDGIHMARITTFPTLSARIWNFSSNYNERFVKLDGTLGTPELIGFISDKNILIRWQQTTGMALEVIDVNAAKAVKSFSSPNFEKSGVTLTISHDGTLAAIAAKVNNAPSLLIFNLSTGERISAQIASLDQRWPVTPTGMAFSNDNSHLAVLFEQAGNGLLLCYQIDSAQKQLTACGEYYPSGLAAARDRQFAGNALAWTPRNDGWITYGQSVFSATNGKQIGELGQPNVQSFRVVMPDHVQVITSPQSDTPRQVIMLGLDLDKIAALARQ